MIGPVAATAIAFVFWMTLVLYGFSSFWWLLEVTVLARGWRADDDARYC